MVFIPVMVGKETMEKYDVTLSCSNCGQTNSYSVMKGTKVSEEHCSNCECQTLTLVKAGTTIINRDWDYNTYPTPTYPRPYIGDDIRHNWIVYC